METTAVTIEIPRALAHAIVQFRNKTDESVTALDIARLFDLVLRSRGYHDSHGGSAYYAEAIVPIYQAHLGPSWVPLGPYAAVTEPREGTAVSADG